jgi:hypothetical protein
MFPGRSQAPNLIWPADRSWYVASEYDLDSTLVGCSRHLADAILAAPELEVWRGRKRGESRSGAGGAGQDRQG